MTLKLKPSPSPVPVALFSWDNLPSSPTSPDTPTNPPSPPTQWLSAKDMKIFGASPLSSTAGLVRCKDCEKPVMRSAMAEHAELCAKLRAAAKKAGKGKVEEPVNAGKKRKAEDEDPTPEDPSAPKKKKPATKVNKGRAKGPVDLDRQCGVINDKGLPCSRSLTCKSHSMGAKRAVPGRSRNYDELLLEWNRLNNPNFVEPVKRESKAEKKERKEKEKAEKKRAQQEAAAAAGVDVNKKASGAGGSGTKKTKKPTNTMGGDAANTTAPTAPKVPEEVDDVDSEAEVDALSNAVRLAQDKGVMGVPLAVPCDASSWFVARRERIRTCRELLANALLPPRSGAVGVPIGPGRL